MKKTFIFLFPFLFVLTCFAQEKHRFAADVATIKKYDNIYAPLANPIVFVGSSSIRKWNSLQVAFGEYNVINRGIGGAVIDDITYYLNDLVFDYKPRQIVLYVGENNLPHENETADTVLYPSFDFEIKDTTRCRLWMEDFDKLVAKNEVPSFNTIKFPNDHTSGQRKGRISPTAAIADNDMAVGMFVEHLSHSKIWKESIVVVLEDDAQNGPDHVDAHRSPILVISPYVKRHQVVSTMYSTSGALRTMELVLGLPPMSQYDAAAVPFYDCFTATPDLTPYEHKKSGVNLNIRNMANNKSSKLSESFSFAKEDEAPDLELNQVIWKSVKGEESVMPAPRRSAFVIVEKKKKDDDD